MPLTDTEMALAEALHRARNDLQAVVSMLRLQGSVSRDPAVRAALGDAEIRVLALSSLNVQLDAAVLDNRSALDSATFIAGLAMDFQAMHFGQRPVRLETAVEPHRLPAPQGKPVGLILNELVVNALKYAFPEGGSGTVRIGFVRAGGDYILTVADDGVGMDPLAPPTGTGLGRRMVRALAMQIGGRLDIQPAGGGGTECIVRWPAQDMSG